MIVRRLTQADFEVVDDYLRQHAATTMFMRSNIQQVGLRFEGKSKQAHYFGAFNAADCLRGVLALCWNGILLCQVDDGHSLADLLRAAVAAEPGFEAKGVLAPEWQASLVRDCFGAGLSAYQMCEVDQVYTLPLDQMIVPLALLDGTVRVRQLQESDLDTVAVWNAAYEVEALGEDPNKPGLLREQYDDLKAQLSKNDCYILVDRTGALLSKASFNARLPDIVQIGGVYTPPALRGRGYGRAVCAGILALARQQGVNEAVLFTNVPAAAKAYEAIGFKAVGDYSLCLLKQGVPLS